MPLTNTQIQHLSNWLNTICLANEIPQLLKNLSQQQQDTFFTLIRQYMKDTRIAEWQAQKKQLDDAISEVQ